LPPEPNPLIIMKSNALILLLLLAGCNNKPYTPDQLPVLQLRFGDGGGFTGAVTEYMLLENGQLFYLNSMEKDTMEIGKLKKGEAKSLLREVEALQLEKMDVQEPGNQYYFLGMKTKDRSHQITWGSPNYTIDPTIEAVYKKLMASAKAARKEGSLQ